ncbi:hypothetical protein ABTK62_21020, partial [Acinetobacter baumannii]
VQIFPDNLVCLPHHELISWPIVCARLRWGPHSSRTSRLPFLMRPRRQGALRESAMRWRAETD